MYDIPDGKTTIGIYILVGLLFSMQKLSCIFIYYTNSLIFSCLAFILEKKRKIEDEHQWFGREKNQHTLHRLKNMKQILESSDNFMFS